MGGMLVVVVIIVGVLVLVGLSGLRIVKQATVQIVERLGKYHKTLDAGIHFIVPFLDSVRQISSRVTRSDYQGRSYARTISVNYIDLRERVYDFPRQNVITKDNVTLEINAMLYSQIVDAFKAVYEIENLAMAIEKLTQTTLRNVIGELELDQTLTSRDTINSKLRLILDEATDKWGVKVTRVELQDINPPKDIRDAMEKQMRAERERRQMILVAEGEKQSKVLRAEGERDKLIAEAEGEKQKRILEAEGSSQAIVRVAQADAKAIGVVKDILGGTKTDPAQYLVAMKYVDTLKQIASKEGKEGERLVFMPYESSGVLSSLGSIKEIFNK